MLAFVVDHGLHPDSATWTAQAAAQASSLGARPVVLVWNGQKPTNGLPAAARRARHALIAEAARREGASVVLFGHTADDVAETEWMRARGSALGRLQVWAPSPAWPEGRGVFVLRPLLDVRREPLRAHLRSLHLTWLDDPANADVRFTRTRARAALVEQEQPLLDVAPCATLSHVPEPQTVDGSAFRFPRTVKPAAVSAALLSAGGGTRPPRSQDLQRLAERLRGDETFTATLAGARIQADEEGVLFTRDPGRAGLASMPLTSGEEQVWDGRYSLLVSEPGWTVRAAQGFMAALEPSDRGILRALPPSVRRVVPVLVRDDGARPILAERAAVVTPLGLARLRGACGLIAHEREIADPPRGASGGPSLC